jgi:cytochrome b subunit of formate dehydrogenase
MFRIVSIICFIVCFAGIGAFCAVRPCKGCGWGGGQVLGRLMYLFLLPFIKWRLSLLGMLKKLVYWLALLCFIVLAVTGFAQRLILGKAISGYWLMLHATCAPVFAVCLALLALMWAPRFVFRWGDWPWLEGLIRRFIRLEAAAAEPAGEGFNLGQKITFWLIIILALPLILTIVSSMFTFFGTDYQELLLDLHRYTALALALAAIVHIYLMIRTQMKG